jgi:hypothetical protein
MLTRQVGGASRWLWFAVPLLLVLGLALYGMRGSAPREEPQGNQPALRGAGFDPYSSPLPAGERVSLETVKKGAPVPVLLPEVPGVAEDSSIVDIWMNAQEIYVEYPKGLFVAVVIPDPGAGPPLPSQEAQFEANGGMVTEIGDSIELYFDDARVSIVSLEGAYSADQLKAIEDSIRAAD